MEMVFVDGWRLSEGERGGFFASSSLAGPFLFFTFFPGVTNLNADM